MADKEHLKILRSGMEAWNRWRKENPDIVPNLKEIRLVGADLHGYDFSKALFSDADLSGANLSEVDFRAACLDGVQFCQANLRKANLHWADLSEADLYEADLSFASFWEAGLECASLRKAILYKADLEEINTDSETDFSGARKLLKKQKAQIIYALTKDLQDTWK